MRNRLVKLIPFILIKWYRKYYKYRNRALDYNKIGYPNNNFHGENKKIDCWLYGRKAAMTFTWDDTLHSQYLIIAPILEKYGFCGSFFIETDIADKSVWDAYKQLSLKGHEIGSHTHAVTHVAVTSFSSSQLEENVKQSIREITNNIGVFPLSFAHPFSQSDYDSSKIILNNFPFSRQISTYTLKNRFWTNLLPSYSINELVRSVKKSYKRSSWFILAGHGADGEGYEPITGFWLDKFCSKVKSEFSDLWIDTFRNVAHYEYLKISTHVLVEKSGNLLKIIVSGYDEELFSRFEKNEITIKLDKKFKSLKFRSDLVRIDYKKSNCFITVDLKRAVTYSIDIL